jgi:chromosome segregation ATPase
MSILVSVGPPNDPPLGFKVINNAAFEPNGSYNFNSYVDTARDRAAYQTDVEQLRTEARDKSAELAAASDRKAALEGELTAAQEKLASTTQTLQAKEALLADATAARAEAETELASTKNQLAIAQKNEESSAKISELETQLRTQTDELGKKTSEASALTSERDLLLETKTRLEGQALSLGGELAKFVEAWGGATAFMEKEADLVQRTLQNQDFKTLVAKYISKSETEMSTDDLRIETRKIMEGMENSALSSKAPPGNASKPASNSRGARR